MGEGVSPLLTLGMDLQLKPQAPLVHSLDSSVEPIEQAGYVRPSSTWAPNA